MPVDGQGPDTGGAVPPFIGTAPQMAETVDVPVDRVTAWLSIREHGVCVEVRWTYRDRSRS